MPESKGQFCGTSLQNLKVPDSPYPQIVNLNHYSQPQNQRTEKGQRVQISKCGNTASIVEYLENGNVKPQTDSGRKDGKPTHNQGSRTAGGAGTETAVASGRNRSRNLAGVRAKDESKSQEKLSCVKKEKTSEGANKSKNGGATVPAKRPQSAAKKGDEKGATTAKQGKTSDVKEDIKKPTSTVKNGSKKTPETGGKKTDSKSQDKMQAPPSKTADGKVSKEIKASSTAAGTAATRNSIRIMAK